MIFFPKEAKDIYKWLVRICKRFNGKQEKEEAGVENKHEGKRLKEGSVKLGGGEEKINTGSRVKTEL